MPDPLSHHPDMLNIIRPHTKPRLWWLLPWSHARLWHSAATAMKAYADRLDRALDLQTKVIDDQSREIKTLRRQVEVLSSKHHADA
jgi:hypothetical protein